MSFSVLSLWLLCRKCEGHADGPLALDEWRTVHKWTTVPLQFGDDVESSPMETKGGIKNREG